MFGTQMAAEGTRLSRMKDKGRELQSQGLTVPRPPAFPATGVCIVSTAHTAAFHGAGRLS